MTEAIQMEARDALFKKRDFARWMELPITKALISTIPPSDHIEALLQSCFDAGYSSGSVSVVLYMFEKKSKEPKR